MVRAAAVEGAAADPTESPSTLTPWPFLVTVAWDWKTDIATANGPGPTVTWLLDPKAWMAMLKIVNESVAVRLTR